MHHWTAPRQGCDVSQLTPSLRRTAAAQQQPTFVRHGSCRLDCFADMYASCAPADVWQVGLKRVSAASGTFASCTVHGRRATWGHLRHHTSVKGTR
eukprot:366512-Chlamydomonas_euryale.AAC.10